MKFFDELPNKKEASSFELNFRNFINMYEHTFKWDYESERTHGGDKWMALKDECIKLFNLN